MIANLTREIKKIKGRTRAGVRLAALLVKGRSMDLTPVKTSNLRGSHHARTYDTPKGPMGEVFCGGAVASYAIYVHERLDVRHENGIPKFLSTALAISDKEILEILRNTTRVP